MEQRARNTAAQRLRAKREALNELSKTCFLTEFSRGFFWLPALSFHASLLSYDLVRPCQHVGRNRQADLLCRFQIDHELKFRRLLHRQISRLGTFRILST